MFDLYNFCKAQERILCRPVPIMQLLLLRITLWCHNRCKLSRLWRIVHVLVWTFTKAGMPDDEKASVSWFFLTFANTINHLTDSVLLICRLMERSPKFQALLAKQTLGCFDRAFSSLHCQCRSRQSLCKEIWPRGGAFKHTWHKLCCGKKLVQGLLSLSQKLAGCQLAMQV